MDLVTANNLYKNRPHKAELQTACKLEEETRFYTERFLSTDRPPFKRDFEKWIKDRLNNDNSESNFKTALLYPLKTTQFIEDIYSKLARIWESKNPYFNITYKKDNDKYESVGELIDLKWWREKGWNLLKTNHNCILLVNLAIEQEGDSPEPFIDVIKIQNVIDVQMDGHEIESLMYDYGNNLVAVVDSGSYQLYPIIKKGESLGAAIVDNVNIIGDCPAYFLSNKVFNSENKIVRCNPLTNVLGELKEYLYLHTLKNILDPYAFYLFIVTYGAPGCEFDNGTERCHKGLLVSTVKGVTTGPGGNNYIRNESGTGYKTCPKCNRSIAVGNVIKRPVPSDPMDKDLSTPVQFIAPPSDILKYGNDYLKSYGDALRNSIIGNKQEINTAMSHNEVTFRYTIEDQTSVLINLKSLFDEIIREITKAKVEIIHGGEDVINEVTIDLGNDFLLLDVQDLYDEKESANKLGLSTVLDFNDRIIETKYRNNPDLKLKAKLINAFRPFDENMSVIDANYIAKAISKKDYYKAKYLDQFINWYEIEKQSIHVLIKTGDLKYGLSELNKAFDEYFAIKATEIETSQKMLSEIIGVGGTQSMITILTDPNLAPEQKSLMLQKLFNIDKIEADSMTIKETNNNLIT
jgi:hypothetical protein